MFHSIVLKHCQVYHNLKYSNTQHSIFIIFYVLASCIEIDLLYISSAFLLRSTYDMRFYEQLSCCFYKSRGPRPYQCTWSVLSVFSEVLVTYLPLFSCVFCFVFFSCFLFVYLFSSSGHYPLIVHFFY